MDFLFGGRVDGVLLLDGRLLCHRVILDDEFRLWQFALLLSLSTLLYYFLFVSSFLLFRLDGWLGLLLLFLFDFFHFSVDFFLFFQEQLSLPPDELFLLGDEVLMLVPDHLLLGHEVLAEPLGITFVFQFQVLLLFFVLLPEWLLHQTLFPRPGFVLVGGFLHELGLVFGGVDAQCLLDDAGRPVLRPMVPVLHHFIHHQHPFIQDRVAAEGYDPFLFTPIDLAP